MSIKPLDLQTMFVRLNEVSKEQSQTQQAAALQQNEEARKLVEKELQQGHSVQAVKEDQEAGTVRDKDSGGASGEDGGGQGSPGRKDEEKRKTSVVQDPEMGKHIDISG